MKLIEVSRFIPTAIFNDLSAAAIGLSQIACFAGIGSTQHGSVSLLAINKSPRGVSATTERLVFKVLSQLKLNRVKKL